MELISIHVPLDYVLENCLIFYILKVRSDYVDDLVDNYPSPVKHYDQVFYAKMVKAMMGMGHMEKIIVVMKHHW